MFKRIAEFTIKKRPEKPKPIYKKTESRIYIDDPVLSAGIKYYPVVKYLAHNNPIVPNFKTLEYFQTREEAQEYIEGLSNERC